LNGPAAGAGALLVILPHNPGDVVMALQAIRRIKADFPGLEVDYLVGEECRVLVEGSPLIRKSRVIPKRALKELWASGDAAGLTGRLEGFLGELASVHYRLSANLFQERSGGLIQTFVDADHKIGLEFVDDRNFQVKSRFLEHLFAVPADRAGNAWHVVDIYIRAIARALESTEAKSPRAPERRAPERRAENAISLLPPLIRPDCAKTLVPGEYLAFHPGSAWRGKRWPESHWADLAARCVRGGFTVALTGAPEERPLIDGILSRLDAQARNSVVDCAGATSLAGAAWIYAHARMAVTGDTVAMHLAAAASTPTLSLFGASNPVETGPYGKGHVIIQTEANPPPDLAFETDHPGLLHLRAEEVAGYLLDGVPPAGFTLWETGWDGDERMQVLRDRSRRPHPSLERSAGLRHTLDQEGDRPSAGAAKAPNPAGEGGDLLRALNACIADPGKQNRDALEAAEWEWAQETGSHLVWEAYRIAVNGIPLSHLGDHLRARLARLQSAFREAETAR
jgi:ADP-heptose:LPS heptosyltransferase